MKLNYKRTFFVGLAFLSICAFWQLYDSIIPLILKNTFQIDHTWSGVIMALDNACAVLAAAVWNALPIKPIRALADGRHISFLEPSVR